MLCKKFPGSSIGKRAVRIVRPSTTLLVSPGAEGLGLLSVEQPEQHLAMHGRQRASRDGGGERPRREAEAGSSGKT